MDKKMYLMQYDCITGDEHKLWYIASWFSYLMEIDRATGEMKVLLSLKREGHYRALIKDGNRLLLVPSGKGNLWSYDVTNGETESCPVPDSVFQEGENWSAQYIRLGNFVYFSWASPVIVRYDLSECQWKVLTEWKKLLPKDCVCKQWFWNAPFFYDGFLYFQVETSRMILKLNPNNNNFDMVSLQIPEGIVSIDHMLFSNGELWLECRNADGAASIYCCRDCSTFQCERIYDFDMEAVGNGHIRFLWLMEKVGDKLLLLPKCHDKAYLLNVENQTVDVMNQFPAVSCDRMRTYGEGRFKFNYYRGFRLRNSFLIMHSWTHQLIEVDCDECNVKEIPITLSDNMFDRIIKEELEVGAIHYEGFLGLEDLLYFVLSKGGMGDMEESSRGVDIPCNGNIYSAIFLDL